MPPVAATTPSLKFCVTWINFDRYAISSANNVPKVKLTACMTIPGYCFSNNADKPPNNAPSHNAYGIAV